MPRITVTVPENVEEWLDSEADRLGWSKSKAGGRCIEMMHDESGRIDVMQSESESDADVHQVDARLDDLEERVDELEDRMAKLEGGKSPLPDATLSEDDSARVGDSRGDMTNTPRKSPREPGPTAPAEGRDVDADTLLDDYRAWLEAEDKPPKTTHGRGAVVDALRHLRQNGKSDTSEVQNAVYPAYTDDWTNARTMWNSIDRYMKELPGFEHGYGSWDYAGDDDLRAVLGEHTDGR